MAKPPSAKMYFVRQSTRCWRWASWENREGRRLGRDRIRYKSPLHLPPPGLLFGLTPHLDMPLGVCLLFFCFDPIFLASDGSAYGHRPMSPFSSRPILALACDHRAVVLSRARVSSASPRACFGCFDLIFLLRICRFLAITSGVWD